MLRVTKVASCMACLIHVQAPTCIFLFWVFSWCFNIPVASRLWDNPFTGQVRLSHGNYSSQGLVEVYCNGQWGTVCDDSFFQNELADTICRQLGYTEGTWNNDMWVFTVLWDHPVIATCNVNCAIIINNSSKSGSHLKILMVSFCPADIISTRI